jgi:hypothetical protein
MWNISNILVTRQQMVQDVHVTLNPGLPWQKQLSTARRLSSPADWT